MCGLVGVAGNLFKKEIDAFNDLLWCDSLRGMDSTGVASAKPNGDVVYLKAVGPAPDLMNLRGYSDVTSMANRVIIGHNRAGTIGAKTKYNAHPFIFDEVFGAHNGTVDYASKNRMIKGGEFQTDSEAIFNNIAIEGIDATLPKLDGAWALVFVDRDKNTLNMIRNDKRPLFYAYGKDKKQLFWSSEVGLLMWVLARNGIEYEKINQLPVDLLHTWEITKGSDPFAEPVTRGIEGFKKLAEPVQNFRERWPALQSTSSQGSSGSSSANRADASVGHPESGGDSKAFPTEEAILAAIENVLGSAHLNWWDDQVIVDIFDSDDDNPWAYGSNELADQWLIRVKTMLNLGWEFGDENASSAVKPQAREAVVVGSPPSVLVGEQPILNTAKTDIWNPVTKRWQKFPSGRKQPAWWNSKLDLWVFREEDKDVSTLRFNSVTTPLITEPNKVTQALNDYNRFEELCRKIDSGKRLTKEEHAWFKAYEDDGDDEGEYEVTVTKPITEVAFLNAKAEAAHKKVEAETFNYRHPTTRSIMTQAEFDEITHQGCDWCHSTINWGDAAKFYKSQDSIECFCSKCVEVPEVKEYLRIA
jgi:predicted glutamine amidotransferase